MPFLIDGHNLIGKMKHLCLSDPEDEIKLISHLKKYHTARGKNIIVVFDSNDAPGPQRPLTLPSGIKVIFAPLKRTADQVIKEMIEKEPNPKGLIVVSSDNEVIRFAKRRRAKVLASEDFAHEIETLKERPRLCPIPSKEASMPPLSEEEIQQWLEFFQSSHKEDEE